ncbi:MAG: peptide chain release factor N(5)-glutamine methyltransferase [Sulfurovum sp.]|nr:peptide chain release factor N(5)-glutamine methyltransferase [Sulfurovum sp.]
MLKLKMTLHEATQWAKSQLKEVCERPAYEAELLLAYHIQENRVYLMTHEHDEVLDLEAFEALIERRSNYEPYEYIVGEASFYDIHLAVEKGVLIPRPETEILIDFVAKVIAEHSLKYIAEIGVGSGAISIVLARKFLHISIIATDISEAPLRVAQQNIETFGLQNQITLRQSNLIDEVSEPVDLVVSNPPYIANDIILASNVANYEPKEALFGGRVGDELLKQIIVDVKARGIGYLACEMGYDQKSPYRSVC